MEYVTLAVREGSHGIFDNIDDFKQVMIVSEQLKLQYRVVSILPMDASPVYTEFRWKASQFFNFEERGKANGYVLYEVFPINNSD